ncbi:MAG: hypothetical protein H7Z13_19895 [Ferruginibacter sp.]|nr:hypothetical protein [Ferruginibacter sp.]
MNNINRYNYETFFLLYTDNELAVAEREAVDEFVQANPDLRKELEILQQTTLKPDNIVFENKMSLLKKDLVFTRAQENLLLYLDNELTVTECHEMEGIIATDADIKKEWIILQQTKLLPGKAIVFTAKHSLYRKEAGRRVAFPWRRLAVAAIFIGFGIWGGIVYLNNDTKVGSGKLVKKNPSIINFDTARLDAKQTATPHQSPVAKEKDIATTPVNTKNYSADSTKQPGEKLVQRPLVNVDIQIAAVKENSNNLPKPYFNNINSVDSNTNSTTYVKQVKQPSGVDNPENNSNKQDLRNGYAATTSFTENGEDNNNRVLFMDEEKIKKTKLGGIFKKVKRVLERTANIKPGGNNIKVANIEFAIQ